MNRPEFVKRPQTVNDVIPQEGELIAIRESCGHFGGIWWAQQIGKAGVWATDTDSGTEQFFPLDDVVCLGLVVL